MKREPKDSIERQRAKEALEAIGWHNKRISHAKEPENRRADSLKMIFRDDARKYPRFSEGEVRFSFNEDKITAVFILVALGRMACYPGQVENSKFEYSYESFKPEEIASYVNEAIQPFLKK